MTIGKSNLDNLCSLVKNPLWSFQTHGEGTTVSPNKFFGFHEREIQESFLEWKTGNLILSKIFSSDDGSVIYDVNRNTHIIKMTEDIDEVGKEVKGIQRNGEPDDTEFHGDICSGAQNIVCGPNISSCISENGIAQAEMHGHLNILHPKKSSTPIEESLALSSDQSTGINPDVQSASAFAGRGPSPLLFTPVKGEDTHGAGILSQKISFQVTPTSGKVISSSDNHTSRLCTPSPKLVRKATAELNSNGLNFSVGKKRSSQQCLNDSSDESGNLSSLSSELKLKHSRSECISSPVKPTVSPSHISNNSLVKELDISIVFPSPAKCMGPNRKAIAAQVDSSPSPSESSDTSLFITPKKEEINVLALQVKPAHQNAHIRTKRKHRLRTLVSRARHSLAGIPPPPSFTIPQITVDEMLQKLCGRTTFVSCDGHTDATPWSPNVSNDISSTDSPSYSFEGRDQDNLETDDVSTVMMCGLENTRDDSELRCSPKRIVREGVNSVPSPALEVKKISYEKTHEFHSLFHPSASEKEIMDMTWPTVLDCVHPGICYNLGVSSEALEELCQQVREKYVGNETASSCTIWSTSSASRRSSPRQRKSSNSQANTQVREGYLMRRRRAFSLASLSSSIPSLGSKSRQILVNKVTKLSVESKKPPKGMEDKMKLISKEGQKISLLKKLVDQEGSNKLKRSYSFNDSSVSNTQVSSSVLEPSFFSPSSSKLMSTKRVLKFDRLPRASSSPSLDASSSHSKLSISTFSSQKSCDNIISVVDNTPDHLKNRSSHPAGSVTKDLSEVYKKKLLWAVAEALRSRGLGTGHEKFKLCAVPLFRCCRETFIALPSVDTSVSRDRRSEETIGEGAVDAKPDVPKERTSDKMLNIALQLVDQVMNEVGVEPVIKDKHASA